MPKLVDLTGERFGKLTVISRDGSFSGHVGWFCRCDCVSTITTSSNSLRRGRVHSCGCIRSKFVVTQSKKGASRRAEQLTKHGQCASRLYSIWKSMRQRCHNPNDKYYANYGGRGIAIGPEWDDFDVFRSWAIANGYDSEAYFGQCTIDRINNDGNYTPDNCRFVDLKVQANNRRKRRNV